MKVFDEDLCNIMSTLDRKIDDSELALRLPFNLSIRKAVPHTRSRATSSLLWCRDETYW